MISSSLRWYADTHDPFHERKGCMKLRGGLPIVNGGPLNREELNRELRFRNHDLICEEGHWMWLVGPNYHHAVKSFDALKDDSKYVTARSAEHAWRIHLENVEKGVVDLEPIRPAADRVASGIMLTGALLGTSALLRSTAALISALKSDGKGSRP